MIMTAANRYAEAMLALAVSAGAVDEYQKELEAVSQIYQEENGLKAFLLCPQKERSAKKAILKEAFGCLGEKNILSLLYLLLDKNRIPLTPEICSAYVRLADEYRNLLNITVTTALPLEQKQIDEIGEKFRAVCRGSSVKITVETDRSLIGGVKVQIGDRLFDGSVKGKLSKMKTAIAGQQLDL